MNGLFDLDILAESSESNGDLLGMEINETAELKDHCPSMDPTQHFDADNSGNKQISVPGGLNEKPSAKPAGGEVDIAVPGGISEKPSTSFKEVSIPNTPKVLLDDQTYNAALDQLQKSFKEGYETMQMLRNAMVQTESFEEQYNKYMEEAMADAVMNFSETVLFERVKSEDKADVKEIVSKIRDDVGKFLKEQKYKFYKPRLVIPLISTLLGPIGAVAFGAPKAWAQVLTTRLWQVLGCCLCEEGQIDALMKNLNAKFKDELGGYKIIKYHTVGNFADAFRAKFNWKNQSGVYFLLVDKKMPAELEKALKGLDEADLKSEKKAEEKKEEKKAE